jgi:hypothetical protein
VASFRWARQRRQQGRRRSLIFAVKTIAGGGYIGENTGCVEGGLPNRLYLDFKLNSLISLGFLQRGSKPMLLRIKTVWSGGDLTRPRRCTGPQLRESLGGTAQWSLEQRWHSRLHRWAVMRQRTNAAGVRPMGRCWAAQLGLAG